MNVRVTNGDIVTLGYQYYSEYDIIIRCLKEMDLLVEIERVRTEYGILEMSLDVSLPKIVVTLQQQGVVELVQPKANLYWDSSEPVLQRVISRPPHLYAETLLEIEELTSGA